MPRFQLTKEQFTKTYEELDKSYQEVRKLLDTMESKGLEEAHIFEQDEITSILAYLNAKPYKDVYEVLNSVFPLHSLPEPSVEPPIVEAEVVSSPPETSLPENS